MTHPPDPALADSFVNWGFFIVAAVLSFWKRKQQNKETVAEFKAASAEEVAELKVIVGELKSSQESSQTRSALMTEKLNHLDGTLTEVKGQIAEFQKALPQTTDVLSKVLNVLERLKGGTLVETKVAPGVTKLKPKE